MKIIGITGGVGAGKSTVMQELKEEYNVAVILADEVGKQVMEPNEEAYNQLVAHYGTSILNEGKQIERQKLAAIIFSNEEEKERVNGIIHPIVNKKIAKILEEYKNEEKQVVAIEAALLIEEGYHKICHELWYIKTSEQERIRRLHESRGYTKEKSVSIMKSQMSEKEFETYCQVVIINDGSMNSLRKQIGNALKNC